MDIRRLLALLRKHPFLLIVPVIVASVAALGASMLTAPTYQSSAQVLIISRQSGIGAASTADTFSSQLIQSFAQVMSTERIAAVAVQDGHLATTPAALAGNTTATQVGTSLLMQIQSSASNPLVAEQDTQAMTAAFINQLPALAGGPTLQASVVAPAGPGAKTAPHTSLDVAMGAALGLALGAGLVLLAEQLDTKIRAASVLEEESGAAVLGIIPQFDATAHPLVVEQSTHAPAAEAFRRLRTSMSYLRVTHPSLCCVVTSPVAAEGKSTVASNLAIALARAGERVILIDGDLRKPRVHALFDLSPNWGTTSVLVNNMRGATALRWSREDRLGVLVAGDVPPNAAELLGSARMREMLAELRTQADVILIDAPPLLPVADALVTAQLADGVILVARSGLTTREQIRAARATCGRAGVRILGTVLNAAVASGSGTYDEGYYDQSYDAALPTVTVSSNGSSGHAAQSSAHPGTGDTGERR